MADFVMQKHATDKLPPRWRLHTGPVKRMFCVRDNAISCSSRQKCSSTS